MCTCFVMHSYKLCLNTWAENAVSDNLLAALSKPQNFGNRSQLKAWLVDIF